jgi:glucose repression regulatory protein TUP1
MVPGRSAGVLEWLDMIKQEYENLSHEVAAANVQKEEYEHKSMSCAGYFASMDGTSQRSSQTNPGDFISTSWLVNTQVQEMETFRRALYDLERKHEAMKNQYHM